MKKIPVILLLFLACAAFAKEDSTYHHGKKEVHVFYRWGKMVKRTTSWTGWNGKEHYIYEYWDDKGRKISYFRKKQESRDKAIIYVVWVFRQEGHLCLCRGIREEKKRLVKF
jgi:hypothetical protein